ncbi:MRN complex-interacting protein [Salminus brasiliensis]|uniref:MRN complex-interacting protein n=1 Tax=Salminus brasiliensis TaxID=930266 RepID=UPI003B833CD2
MVQEFHVLRCFSCQTFQVQQVKKSKKWSCKMCGEKQSLIKEYGRGTGADCRRHVQKLNSMRGELLEVENERAWTQWEKEEECEAKDRSGDEGQSCEQQEDMRATVSRWSKYVDQTENEPRGDEDEEENIYTERDRFRSCDKVSRKRQKSFISKGASGRYTVCEDEEPDSDPTHWNAKGLPFQLHQRGGSFKSSPAAGCSSNISPFTRMHSNTSTYPICHSPAASLNSEHMAVFSGVKATRACYTEATKQPSKELTTKCHSSVPASNSLPPSCTSQQSSERKIEAGSSKWTRFLTSGSVEEDEDETEDNTCAQMSCRRPDAEIAYSPSAPLMAVPTVTHTNPGHLRSTERLCARAPLDEVPDLGNKSTMRVFEKLNQCMTGMTSNSPPTFTSKSEVSHSPVCFQPPPSKRPCPALSLNTFFQTNEDFDDTL